MNHGHISFISERILVASEKKSTLDDGRLKNEKRINIVLIKKLKFNSINRKMR